MGRKFEIIVLFVLIIGLILFSQNVHAEFNMTNQLSGYFDADFPGNFTANENIRDNNLTMHGVTNVTSGGFLHNGYNITGGNTNYLTAANLAGGSFVGNKPKTLCYAAMVTNIPGGIYQHLINYGDPAGAQDNALGNYIDPSGYIWLYLVSDDVNTTKRMTINIPTVICDSYNGSVIQVDINGTNVINATKTLSGTQGQLNFGTDVSNGVGNTLQGGYLDEVGIWNRTVNYSERLAWYNNISAGIAYPWTVVPPIGNLSISVNDTRSNALITNFGWNYTTTNNSDNNAKNGYCTTTSCSITNFTGTLNITIFNVSGGSTFNPYDSPKLNFVYNSTQNSYIFNTFQNSLQVNITNIVNNSGIPQLCVQWTNSTFSSSNCTNATTLLFYNVTGNVTITYYGVGSGDGNPSNAIYYNVTHNIGVFNNTLVNFTNTTYQSLLNVSAYRLFLNTSIANFNVTNNLAKNNSPVNNYAVIPANNGSNNIQVDVRGNYSQNYTCTISQPFTTSYCNGTGIYDANVTIVANNGSANLQSFNLLISNLTLGTLFNNSVMNSLNIGMLQGYYYSFNASLGSYTSNSTVYQVNSTVQLVNLTLLPITVKVTFLDEISRSLLSGLNISFTVIDGGGGQTAYSTNTSSITLSGNLPPGNYTFRYAAVGYSTRDYYFVLGAGQPLVNQTLYLINQSTYTPGIVEVRTSDGALVSGAIISMSRFYSDPTVPNIVEMGTSNSFGQRVMTLQPVIGAYLWNVSVDGVVRYLSVVPEPLSIYSDGLWHKTVILNSTASGVANQNTGFNPQFVSPTGSLINGTSYTFTFNITSIFWSMTGCTYQLVNDSNGVILNSSTGWCGANSGTTSITYTTDQSAYKVDGVATITTAYFTNTYQHGYGVILNSNESFTLNTAIGDITKFNGSGFNDFDRFLISVIVIIGTVVSLSETTDLIANDAEVLLLVFLLSAGFSYANWMRLSLPFVTYPGVQQWGICILIGVMTLVQVVRRYGGQG